MMIEFNSHEFDTKQKCVSLAQYIKHKDDFMLAFGSILNTLWPIEPTRMIRLTINNLRLKNELDKEGPVLVSQTN